MTAKKKATRKKAAAVAVPEESLSLHERIDRLEAHTFGKKKKPAVKRSSEPEPEPEPELEDEPELDEDPDEHEE